MSEKCPYCYRPLETWKHDPILLSNGCPYIWLNDTTLVNESDIDQRFYKGSYQINIDDILEIQEELEVLEEEYILEPNRTIFSPVNNTGKFQVTGQHIKEMRDSIEKLLNFFGIEKKDYFNYDENQNHIIHPNGDKLEWTDPITEATDLQNFQIKYIHIEDLRHIIYRVWIETWSAFPNLNLDSASSFIGDKGEYALDSSNNFHLATTHYKSTSDIWRKTEGGVYKSRIYIRQYYVEEWTTEFLWGHSQSMYGTYPIPMSNPVPYLVPNMTASWNGFVSFSKSGQLHPDYEDDYYLYLSVRFRFSTPTGTKWLYYHTGIAMPSPGDFSITPGEFANFNRNLYEDYNTKYGSYPDPAARVRDVAFAKFCEGIVDYSVEGSILTMSIDFTVDNIKLQVSH